MSLRNQLLNTLLFTHIFISVCASALTWGSITFIGDKMQSWPLVLFTFCGTLWIYNLHRTAGALMTPREDWSTRINLFYRYRKINLSLSILTLLILMFIVWTYLWGIVLYLVPPMVISVAYILPTGNGKLIRNIPFLKIFLIAFTWTWVTIFLPFAYHDSASFDNQVLMAMMVERFLFIFAITIPFDIRDVEEDQRESLDTIVKAVGPSRAKYLSVILLLFSLATGAYLYTEQIWEFNYWLIHICIIFYAGVLVNFSETNRSHHYYSWGLDGTMLLLGIFEGLYFTI